MDKNTATVIILSMKDSEFRKHLENIDKIRMTESYGGFSSGRVAEIIKVGNKFYADFGDYKKSFGWIKTVVLQELARPIQVCYGNDC